MQPDSRMWRPVGDLQSPKTRSGLPEPAAHRRGSLMHDDPGVSVASLDDVLITRELFARPARPADFAAESDALQRLVPFLAGGPHTLPQRPLALARGSCGGGAS